MVSYIRLTHLPRTAVKIRQNMDNSFVKALENSFFRKEHPSPGSRGRGHIKRGIRTKQKTLLVLD